MTRRTRRSRPLCTFARVLARALLLSVLPWAAGSASAQVAVLRVDPAAETLCQDLELALAEFGIAPDPGYFAEAQRRGLDPSSDEALTLLTPPLQVQLAVVPQASDARSVTVEFRDGTSGAPLGTARIPFERGALGTRGSRLLIDRVRELLAARADTAQPPPLQSDAPAEPEAEPDAEAEPESEPEADGDEHETGLIARAYTGIGLGTRDLEWPSSGEMRVVETGAFVAVEAGAAFALALSDALALGPELVYQTSLDHEIDEEHIAGETQHMGIRAHRFEALLSLTVGVGKSRNFRIAPALGYGVRALHPEVHHLLTPSYSLTGPLVRITLRIPFGDSLALRLAPELQYLLVGDALEELGVSSSGFAFGGDAALELTLSTHLAIELTFRQANAIMSSALGPDSTDVERFASLRVVWRP
jgi:hypothetical protein